MLKKGRVRTNYDFQLGRRIIPSASEKPVNCLRKYFDDRLRNTRNTTNTVEELQQWMESIDKSGLQDLDTPAESTPSDFVAFVGVRYTNVQGRSYGVPDFKISSPMAINTTVL